MKRIYVSFFTTITIALTSTLVAFVTRDDAAHVVKMDQSTQQVIQDSAITGRQNDLRTFN